MLEEPMKVKIENLETWDLSKKELPQKKIFSSSFSRKKVDTDVSSCRLLALVATGWMWLDPRCKSSPLLYSARKYFHFKNFQRLNWTRWGQSLRHVEPSSGSLMLEPSGNKQVKASKCIHTCKKQVHWFYSKYLILRCWRLLEIFTTFDNDHF